MCSSEGELRALIDCELSAASAESVTLHISGCKKCARTAACLRKRAVMVGAEIGALDSLLDQDDIHVRKPLAELMRRAEETRPRVRRWMVAACAVPVAAALAAVLVMTSSANRTAAHLVVAVKAVAPKAGRENLDVRLPVVKRMVAKRHRVRKAEFSLAGFLPLDDSEPLESGIVVRMNIPRTVFASMAATPMERQAAGEIEADVLVGQDGSARAVRFVR